MEWDLSSSLRPLPHPHHFLPQDRSQLWEPKPGSQSGRPTPTNRLASLHPFFLLVLRSPLLRPVWPLSRPMPRPTLRRASSIRSCCSNSNRLNHRGDHPAASRILRLHSQVNYAYFVVVYILWTFVLCLVSCLWMSGDSSS